MLHDLESARSQIVEKKISITGPVSIGAIPTIAPYFLSSVPVTFLQKCPLAREDGDGSDHGLAARERRMREEGNLGSQGSLLGILGGN